MKKTILFAALLTMLGALTSCLRDDDLELFRHPIHVTGSVDPHWGIPVAFGEMNFSDMLSYLSAEYSGFVNPDSNIITIEYETSASDTIHGSEMGAKGRRGSFPRTRHLGAKDATTYFTKDSIVQDTVYVDFFDNVQSLEGLSLEHVWLKLKVSAYGHGDTSLARYVKVRFDQLEVWYDDHNNHRVKFTPEQMDLDTVNIVVNTLLDTVKREFPTIDMSSIVNALPKKIYARYHIKLQVSNEIISSNIASMSYAQILDSLRHYEFIYKADMALQLPLMVQMNNLHYVFDLDLGAGMSSVNLDSIFGSLGEGIDVKVGDSKFIMRVDNGIPLKMKLKAQAYNGSSSNPNYLWTAFDTVVASAKLGPTADPNVSQAIADSTTRLEVSMTQQNIDDLKRATAMRVSITVDSDNGNKSVAIKREDFLKVKAYLQVHPTATFDIPVTNGGILK